MMGFCNFFFVCVTLFEQDSVSLYLWSYLPPCCPWPSFTSRQLFWGCVSLLLTLGVCGVVLLRLTQGVPARLTVCLEALCAFAVCFSAVLLAAWHRDAQGDILCLAGGAGKAYLLLPLSGAACHLQAALTCLVWNCSVKWTECEVT